MSIEAATIASRVAVVGLDKAEADLLRFSRSVDKTGDQVVTGGKKASQGLNGVQDSITGLNAGLGVLGLSVGIGSLLAFGNDALQSANALEKTEATVRALSGSQARYNDVLEQARQGQQLYGGTLQANLAALGSFVNLSNRTGIELTNIDNIARRLATVDPAQGISGAATALREALSGSGAESLISLRDRFEIPKEAIAAMGREGITAAEKMAILEGALNDLGITNEVLTNSTNTNAAAFDRFGAAVDTAKTAIGGFLQDALLPYIETATGLLGIFSGTEAGLLGYANAIVGLTGIGRELTEAEQEQVLAIGRFLGIVDEATDATEQLTGRTAEYVTYLQQAAPATRGFSIELSASDRAAQDNAQSIDTLTDKIGVYEDAVSGAQDALNRHNLLTQVAERSTRDEEKAVDDATAAVAAQDRVVRQAEAGLDQYTDAIKGAEGAVKGAERQIRDLEAALDDEKAAVKAASDAIADKQDEIKDAERAYDGYEDAIDRANKRLDRQKGYTDAAKESFDSLKDSISAVEREIDRLKGTPLVGSAEMQAQLDAIEDERTKLELAIVQAKRAGADDSVIEGLEKQLEQLELQAEEIELADKVANDADRRKIEQFGETVKEMSSAEILAQLQRQQQSLDGLTRQLGPVEAAWLAQVEAQKGAERSVERAQRAYERYKDSLKPLRTELDELKRRLDDANAALQTEDEKIEPLRLSLAGLKQNVDDARTAYDNANTAIDTQRQYLETLKLRQDEASLALAAAEKLLEPYYTKQQILNDKLVDANLALANANTLYGPQITHLKNWEPAAAAAAKAGQLLADAYNAVADAQNRVSDAVRNAPPARSGTGSVYDGTTGGTGGTGDTARGTIRNTTDADDPRPTQAGINTVVTGAGIASSGGTFDSGRSEYPGGHQGLDLQISNGTPITAPLDLYILGAGPDQFTTSGWTVIATDRKGREWLFAHMQAVNPDLPVQTWVGKGTVLGWVGYGHVHVQLRDRPGGQTIDPSQALNDAVAAIDANTLNDVYRALGDEATAPIGATPDAMRAVEDAAYVIDVSVDTLRKAAGYESSDTLSGAMLALKADLTLALQTLMDIAGQFSKEGVEAGSEFALSTEDMLSLIIPAITSMQALQKYEGIAPNLLDWFGADLRLVIDKLLDVAHYYQTEGVVAAAELYAALQPVLGIIDTVVARVAYFRDYQGILPNLLDWFGADARLIVDKLLDIAQYYNSDGANAAADTLEGLTRTLEPITALQGIADVIRNYKGFPTTNLHWIGGDMRAVVDKVIDVDRYIGGGEDAASRVNTTLMAVRDAMLTGMSLGDAVSGYRGGGQAEAVFGDITEFTDDVILYFHEVRRDGVAPSIAVLESQLYLGGQSAVAALHDGLVSDLSGVESAGRAAAEAYWAGWNSVNGQSRSGRDFWSPGSYTDLLASMGEN